MKFRLVEDFLCEEYYYKVIYTYDDGGKAKRDYVYAIGNKDSMDNAPSDLLKIDTRHEKQGKKLPDEYKIVQVKPVDKSEVLKKSKDGSHLFNLTDSILRSQTRTTIRKDADIKRFNKKNGYNGMMSHHSEHNELITRDKRFIDVIPYIKGNSVNKMISNTLHQAFEVGLLNRKQKSKFKHPVYIYNPDTCQYEEHWVTISFK